MAQSILQENGMDEALDGKLVISILAGMTIAQLEQWVPKSCRVVRAMPNTPTKVRSSLSKLQIQDRSRSAKA
jgi:pyrroline-5-carboxylate reductase